MASAASGAMLTMEEVKKHGTKDDCWVVIHGSAYDLTKFSRAHPGGAKIIHECAGMDATVIFAQTHPSDMMERMLKPEMNKGQVDPATITADYIVKPPPKALPPPMKIAEESDEKTGEPKEFVKPALSAMMNTFDFESVASVVMDPQGWAYYSSGGDDEISLRDNHLAFQRIIQRPRILKNVAEISLTTEILGVPSSLPLYFTATALGHLAHPDGEKAIVRGAHKSGVAYMLPTLSGFSLPDMLGARSPGQQLFAQLYVNPDRSKTQAYIEKLEAAGIRALFVTVDAPQLGRREKDMRAKYTHSAANEQADDEEAGEVDRSQGAARAISSFIDPSLCWDDIAWLKSITKMKILLKGVQCGEDAVLAYQAGLDGVVLSNHGGRQLDTCRSGIEVLPEVIDDLRACGYSKDKFAVLVDGGIRRGADIFKAIALGASAVGVGRPVLYSLASYGEKGIVRMVQLLQDELTMVMRLSGTASISDITPKHVITKNLSDHIVALPEDALVKSTYQPLKPAAKL